MVYNAPTRLSGQVASIDEEPVRRIRELPSVADLTVKVKPGGTIVPTRDLLTSPLRIFMTAPDQAALDADYAFIDSVREQVFELRS